MAWLDLDRLQRMLGSGAVPHHIALGLRAVACDGIHVDIELPYAADLVGNPDTGVLHGGALSALIDCACAVAVYLKQDRPSRIATIDLRIEYARLPRPGRDIIARAECHKLGHQVAFSRAVAFEDDAGDPVATASGTFMLFPEEPLPSVRLMEPL